MDGSYAGAFAKITRSENGFPARIVSMVGIYPCTSVRDPEMSAALAKALASKAVLKLKCVRTDHHQEEETCLAHRGDICLSTAETRSRNQGN